MFNANDRFMIIRQRTGFHICNIGPYIHNNNRVFKNLSPYDPIHHHRSVHPGINLQGMCSNPKCRFCYQMVLVPLGYGKILYSEKLQNCTCPVCKSDLKSENIFNIGYRNAKIKFVGVIQSRIRVDFKDEERQGQLIKFMRNDGQVVNWSMLMMEVHQVDENSHLSAVKIQLPIQHLPLQSQWGVQGGINFQGICTNRKCQGSFKRVRVPLGYGAVFFGEKIYECPCHICAVPINPESIKTVVFHNAKVKIVGKTLEKKNVLIQDQIKNQQMGIYIIQGPFLKIQAKQP